jgi:hypothetical protein
MLVRNNGIYTDVRGYISMSAGSATVTLYRDIFATAWTASGDKSTIGEFFVIIS